MISQTVAMLVTTGLLLSFVYAFKMQDFVAIISNTDRTSMDILNSGFGNGNIYSDMYLEDSKVLTKLNKVICSSTLFCPFMFCLSIPFVDYFKGTYRQRFPVPAKCPFEKMTPGVYEVLVFLQFLTSAFPALQKIGNEFIIMALLRIQATYYKYLSVTIKQIGQEIGKESTSETNNKIIWWVKLHQKTLRNVQDFQDLLSPIVIVYYLSMIGLVACGLFYQLNAENPDIGQSIALILFLVISLFQFYLLCHMADELSVEAEKMAIEVYCIPWYKMDQRNKDFLRLVINMANRPTDMKAYKSPAFSMSKEAFIGLVVNIVSAYMGFNKIKNLE